MDGLNTRLKSLRMRHKMSVKEIALRLRIASSTYCGYEANKESHHYREPKIETIVRLAKIFNCSVDYLVGNSNLIANYDKQYVISKVEENENIDQVVRQLTVNTINSSLLAI